MKTAMRKCAICKEGNVKKGTVNLEETVAGTRFVAKVKGYRCDKCREEFYDAQVVGRFELQVALELARRGKASSETFRLMHSALGLSSRELAKLPDVTPETISRWPHGKRTIDRSAFATRKGGVALHNFTFFRHGLN
jgi:YgiT-type zinc finger domain-containing protein